MLLLLLDRHLAYSHLLHESRIVLLMLQHLWEHLTWLRLLLLLLLIGVHELATVGHKALLSMHHKRRLLLLLHHLVGRRELLMLMWMLLMLRM